MPPYSPNVAPHEKCIRQVKDSVRDFEKELRNVDAPTLIDFGCSTVTAEVMRSALRECGQTPESAAKISACTCRRAS